MHRKVFIVVCIRDCVVGGVRYIVGSEKKFYSVLGAKHFIKKSNSCFVCI